MTKNPFLSAAGAIIYIGIVALVMNNAPDKIGGVPEVFAGIAFLSLFVLSAAVMGYLFVYQPLLLYLDGAKQEAVNLFLKTLGSFAVFTALLFLSLLIAGSKSSTSLPFMNLGYRIEGQVVLLEGGVAETEASPGSATKIKTKYFGNNAKGDLTGDGIPDLAFLLTQDGGGSGTFYYVVAAIQTARGDYTGTNGILLGDRIAPQSTEIRDGQLIVNYADRKPGEPMTADPSVGTTKYFEVAEGNLVEIEK